MTNAKRRARYKRLMEAVGDILLREWDPLSVADIPGCSGEYDNYVGTICRYLLEGNEFKLVAHLTRLQIDAMGLSWSDEERDRVVARRLLSLSL